MNKFSSTTISERLKQAKLTKKEDLSNVEQRAIENKERIEKLQIFYLNYFLGKSNFGDDEKQHYLLF